ncbi:hypothetical protein MHU86_7357 [Fragilaria crotonensis]|nr:hypothetical protein MHU86_7357 [Fragilaria crotonensis]
MGALSSYPECGSAVAGSANHVLWPIWATKVEGGRPKAGGRKKRTGHGGSEAKGTTVKHRGGEASHHRLRLYVEVPVHLVRPPPTDQANAITVDPGAQQRHGAARTGGANGDVGKGVCGVGMKNECSSNAGCEGSGGDEVKGRVRPRAEGIKGGVGRGAAGAQCDHTATKVEARRSASGQVAWGEGARANPELDVAQAEKGWPGKAEVLARAEQEKEAENEALRRRTRKWGGFGVGCGPDLGDNAKRKGFDP